MPCVFLGSKYREKCFVEWFERQVVVLFPLFVARQLFNVISTICG